MPAPTLALAGERTYEPPPRSANTSIIAAEYPLNRRQSFRAEIIQRDGKLVVAITRWKVTPAGTRRTGQSIEFGAHRAAAIASLLDEVLRVLQTPLNTAAFLRGRSEGGAR